MSSPLFWMTKKYAKCWLLIQGLTVVKALGPRYNIVMRVQCNIAALHGSRKFHRGASCMFFYVQCNKNNSKNVACNTKKNKKSFIFFILHATFLLHEANISKYFFLPWSHSVKRFREAQLLLANHKTCLKRSIPERMFDFKNVHKQYVSSFKIIGG